MTDVPEEVLGGRKLLKQIEKGDWPNFVREASNTRYPIDLYGTSLYMKRDLFTTGGYVSVPGAPTGILMRVTSRPDIGENANVVRILIPSGNFVTSDMMDKMCYFADKYGVGMLHSLSTGHDFEIPGIPKQKIVEFVKEFREAGLDIGSSGDAYRNTTNCIGSALCEYSNFDTLGARDKFYDRFNDFAKYPTFPHKVKVKFSGCPLDCARATQKADIGIVGAWKGAPLIDKNIVKELGEEATDDIVRSCPTLAIDKINGELHVKEEDCIQCMKCLRKGEGRIRTGERKIYQLYVGGKLRGKKGPLSSKLLMRVNTMDEVMEMIQKISDVYSDQAARKERLGDLIFRVGMKGFLEMLKMEPEPLNVKDMRTNLFYAVSEEERKSASEEINGGDQQ